MIYFTIWHYVVLIIIFVLFVFGIIISMRQKNKSMVKPMLFSVILISLSIAFLSVFVVDKYTKHVKLYRLQDKKLYSIEKIIYSGLVKNTGNYTIGTVRLNIKIVNKRHRGNIKSTTFYKSSGFLDFFHGTIKKSKSSNTLTENFVVAHDLKPGKIKSFRIMFNFPSNFRNTSQYVKVSGH